PAVGLKIRRKSTLHLSNAVIPDSTYVLVQTVGPLVIPFQHQTATCPSVRSHPHISFATPIALSLLPSIRMGFRSYSPSTKITAVRMIQQGYTPSVCQALVIRDPHTYQQRGPTFLLSAQDADFMIGLIQAEPDLFLDELRERLYDNTETLLSIATLHRNLVMRLLITLKKANIVNIKKFLTAKYTFIEKMASIPTEYLVFTGKLFFFHITFLFSVRPDLLRVRACSKKGKQANRYLRDQNPKRFTLLPGISFFGLLAVRVTNQTVKHPQLQHFLKYSLCPSFPREPAVPGAHFPLVAYSRLLRP
ncbi:hypothetical protein MJO28_007108, partial [Puccinia striiformis f. sp. tritici]